MFAHIGKAPRFQQVRAGAARSGGCTAGFLLALGIRLHKAVN